ncbi:MAG: hypothetical protein QX203_04070 [Methylococcaceae bacterium]
MKKLIRWLILLSAMSFTAMAHSQNADVPDSGFVLADVLLYRPLGFAATIAGSALFIGISPLTALASIPEPHDAFNKTFTILVLAPAAYTFIRPVGEKRFIGNALKQRTIPATPLAANPVDKTRAIPKQPTATHLPH